MLERVKCGAASLKCGAASILRQQEARPHDRGYRLSKDTYDGPMPPDAGEDVIDQDAGNPKKASKLHYRAVESGDRENER